MLPLKAGKRIKLNDENVEAKPVVAHQSVVREEETGPKEGIDVLQIGLKEEIDVIQIGLKGEIDVIQIGLNEEIAEAMTDLNVEDQTSPNAVNVLHIPITRVLGVSVTTHLETLV